MIAECQLSFRQSCKVAGSQLRPHPTGRLTTTRSVHVLIPPLWPQVRASTNLSGPGKLSRPRARGKQTTISPRST